MWADLIESKCSNYNKHVYSTGTLDISLSSLGLAGHVLDLNTSYLNIAVIICDSEVPDLFLKPKQQMSLKNLP